MKVMGPFTAWPGVPPAECAHDGTEKLQCPFLTRAHRVPRTACHAGPVFSLTSGIRQPPAHWITDNGRTQAVPRPAQGFRFYRPPLLLSRPPAAARMGDRGTFCEAPAPSLWHFDAGTPQEQQNIQKKCAGTTLWAICGQMRSCAPKAGTCSGCGLFVHRARRRSCTGIFFLQLRAEIEKNEVIHRNGRASIYYHY